jgi:SAM-dependent methyltransferase
MVGSLSYDVRGCTWGVSFGEVVLPMGTKEFFDALDKRFYERQMFAHTRYPIFSGFFNYEKYRGKQILEIGCGMGTLVREWARQGAKITGIDLTNTATYLTKKSTVVYGLHANIVQADAETLPFRDSSFNLVYSWGVLHHVPNIVKTIEEIYRVLRPEGELGIMLYNRRSLYFYGMCYLIEGVVHSENSFLDEVGLSSRYYDGVRKEGSPYARVFAESEICKLLRNFGNLKVQVCGTLPWIFRQIFPVLWMYLPRSYYDYWSKKMGSFLWITASK